MLEVKIGEISIIIPEELEEKFRKAVEKWNLQRALIEAIEDWMAKMRNEAGGVV